MIDYSFLSSDGSTSVFSTCFEPDGVAKAGLIIVHGMVEHRKRYFDFANYLASNGYIVVTYDQIGHGQSVTSDDNLGYFGHPDGNKHLILDIHKQVVRFKKNYPDIPLFILGHSMGSFLVRQYIQWHGDGISGAIIMGTGLTPSWLLKFGRSTAKLLSVMGWKHRSKLLTGLAFGSYLKRIKHPNTSRDWISRDKEIVDKYVNDPYCMFTFTVDGFYNMFYSIGASQSTSLIDRIPKDLPLLLVSGKEDPVGSYGEAVLKVKSLYENAGIKNITLKLYDDDRHEILNELDRDVVYADILEWMDKI